MKIGSLIEMKIRLTEKIIFVRKEKISIEDVVKIFEVVIYYRSDKMI